MGRTLEHDEKQRLQKESRGLSGHPTINRTTHYTMQTSQQGPNTLVDRWRDDQGTTSFPIVGCSHWGLFTPGVAPCQANRSALSEAVVDLDAQAVKSRSQSKYVRLQRTERRTRKYVIRPLAAAAAPARALRRQKDYFGGGEMLFLPDTGAQFTPRFTPKWNFFRVASAAR